MTTTYTASFLHKLLAASIHSAASPKYHVLVRRTTLISVTALITFLLAILAPAAGPLSPIGQKVQPQLLAMATTHPNATLSIIVQKAESTEAVEALTAELGGIVTKDLSILNAFAAQLSGQAVLELASHTAVRWISLDGPVANSGSDKGPPRASALPNTYLDTLGVRGVWKLALRGQGIGVAVIDSGIAKSKEFSNLRHVVLASKKPKNNADLFGHGTHVAGIIAGNGSNSNGLYMGIAPAATLYDLKIGDDTGMAYESDIVRAMQWVYQNRLLYNIRVVNLSFNSTIEQSYHKSPMSAAAEVLWFNGVVVVVSVGNKAAGGYNTANAAPAHDPFVITVGAMDEKGTPNSDDDTIASYSAAAVTSTGFAKPDLVAPGSQIVSVLSKRSDWDKQMPERVVADAYFRLSGTSMAAPMVTGAVALLLQDEPNLTPDQVKYRLLNSGARWIDPGNGVMAPYLNIYNAVTGATTQSANTGLVASQLLWTGSQPVAWNSVSWNSVSWNSVSWNSVSWNSVSWNSVSWNSVSWDDGVVGRSALPPATALTQRDPSAINTAAESNLEDELPLAYSLDDSALAEDLQLAEPESALDAPFKVLLPLILR